MIIIPCPDCNKGISDEARVCPHCGKPLSEAQIIAAIEANKKIQEQGNTCLIGCLIVVISFLLMFVLPSCRAATSYTPKIDPVLEAKKADFQEWAKNNFSVQDMDITGSTIRIRMAPEMYTTVKNAESIARTIARAWKMRTGQGANCHVFDMLGREEIASSWDE